MGTKKVADQNNGKNLKKSRNYGRRLLGAILSLALVVSLVMIPSKTVEALEPELGSVTAFLFEFDTAYVDLNTAYYEYQATARFSGSIKSKTNDVIVDKSKSYLAYKGTDGSYYKVGNSDKVQSSGRTYYYVIYVDIASDYKIHSQIMDQIHGMNATSAIEGLVLQVNNTNCKASSIVSTPTDNMSAKFIIPISSIPKAGVSTTQKIAAMGVLPNKGVSVEPGKTKQFNPVIQGNCDLSCTWSISGNKNAGTKISDSGLLTVAARETATKIKVILTSTFDPSMKREVEVRIGKSEVIKTVKLDFDEDGIMLDPAYTEGEVRAKVYAKGSCDETQYYLDTNGNHGILYDYVEANKTNNKGVLDGTFYGIAEGTNKVDPNKDYYLYYTVCHQMGYKWDDKIAQDANTHPITDFPNMSIYINGELRKDLYVKYNSTYEHIEICIPVDTWKQNIAKHSDKLVVSGITDKKYTGSAITQKLTVKFDGTKLTEGKDYTVSYSDNVKAGTAKVIITGKGEYKGSVTKTFKITGSESGGTGNETEDPVDDPEQPTDGQTYSNEWVNGKWYNADGTQDYAPTGSWKCNSSGWWFEDTSGWYPHSQWMKIDGKWYYFLADGYMDYSEYRDGCWLNADGSWDENYSHGKWCKNSTGWWYEDDGWFPVNQWLWIDGVNYHFGADGYWDK